MDRQRRAANPDNYDEKGRIRSAGSKKKLHWRSSKTYEKMRRRKATQERKLAAHRKSLHGQKVHEIVAVGNTIIIEKISYKAWQKQHGRSVGLRAPGMFIEMLRRTVASTGGTLLEVPTRTTKLSQFCHGCGKTLKKPLAQRWHQCACGVGPVQRDLYSAARRESCAYTCLGDIRRYETRYFATGILPGRAVSGNAAVRSSWDNEAAVARPASKS
jgi:Putative transposase DNA-binding domain